MTRKTVAVYPESVLGQNRLLWDALESLVPVKFVASSPEAALADSAVICGGDSQTAMPALGRFKRVFLFASTAATLTTPAREFPVRFANFSELDRRIRGQVLRHEALAVDTEFGGRPGDKILATFGDKPVWLKRTGQGFECDLVACPSPVLKGEERAVDYLRGRHFCQLLPLVHYLREVAGIERSDALRASFMIDDPNLHRPSYGYVDYRDVLRRAREENFHIAFATVPLDSWYADAGVAKLFRENRRFLSLLIHGNDHLRAEFAARQSRAKLARALSRICDLEKRCDLHIDRVMAPPHGACSTQMLRDMFVLGYEGATISHGSLRRWIKDADWPAAFGLLPAEMTHGLPVINRFRLTATAQGEVAISAFLDKPIIAVGHHADLADHAEALRTLADYVNSLGPVHWMNAAELFQTNFHAHQSGSRLAIQPYSASFTYRIPSGVETVAVIPPAAGAEEVNYSIRPLQHKSAWQSCNGSVPVIQESEYEFSAEGWGEVDFTKCEMTKLSLWAISRRILCEVRDRVTPALGRLPTLGRAA